MTTYEKLETINHLLDSLHDEKGQLRSNISLELQIEHIKEIIFTWQKIEMQEICTQCYYYNRVLIENKEDMLSEKQINDLLNKFPYDGMPF